MGGQSSPLPAFLDLAPRSMFRPSIPLPFPVPALLSLFVPATLALGSEQHDGGGGAYEYMPVHGIGAFPRHAVAMYYAEWWALLLLPCYHLYSQASPGCMGRVLAWPRE